MQRLLSTYRPHGAVKPLLGVAVQSRAHSTEKWLCAPPDFAKRLTRVRVPLVPVGKPLHERVLGLTPPSAADLRLRAVELFVAVMAEACDAPVATAVTQTGAWR